MVELSWHLEFFVNDFLLQDTWVLNRDSECQRDKIEGNYLLLIPPILVGLLRQSSYVS